MAYEDLTPAGKVFAWLTVFALLVITTPFAISSWIHWKLRGQL